MKKRSALVFSFCFIAFYCVVCVPLSQATTSVRTRKVDQIKQRQESEMQQKMIEEQRQRQEAIQALAAQQGIRRPRSSQPNLSSPITRQTRVSSGYSTPSHGGSSEVKKIVSLADLWKQFESTSQPWSQMMDLKPKEITIAKYIQSYAQQGIIIRKSPLFYVHRIDDVFQNKKSLMNSPLKDVLKYVAILDYDFENGRDKEDMVRKLLSPQEYEQNQARLSQ